MIGRPRTVSDETILAAVGQAIGRYGPARLTLAHVAEEVGLAPATLLQRFGSKRGLLLAFAAHGATAVSDVFATARVDVSGPLAALVAGLTSLAGSIRSPEELSNHVAMLQTDLSDPAFLTLARDHAVVTVGEIRRLLEEAVAAGELRTADPAGLARALKSVYDGTLLGWAIDRDGALPDRLRQDLETVLAPLRRET
jgi:AcrR family transcriptional regulator